MTGLLYKLGHACARWHFVVLGLWLVLVVALVVVAGQAGSNTTNNVTLPGTGSQSATDLLSKRFPTQAYGTNPIVVATDSGKLTDSKYSKAIKSSVSALKKTPHVTTAVSPLSDAGASALSKNKQIGYISVALDVGQGSITDDDANAVLDAANPAKKAGLQVAAGGYVGQQLSKPDTGASDKIGIAAAMLILLLVFGSAVAMGLPIVTAVLGPAVRPERRDTAQPHRGHPDHGTHAGDHDRARGRDRLLAVHRHQAPNAGLRGDGGPRVDSARDRDGRRRCPVRGRDRGDLPVWRWWSPESRWSRPWATRRRSRWASPSWPRSPCCRPCSGWSARTSRRSSCRSTRTVPPRRSRRCGRGWPRGSRITAGR